MAKMELGNHAGTQTLLDALKKGSGATKKLQMNIPEDLHKEFKMACLMEGKEMTEVCLELVRTWLAQRK
ncbi:plasmid partition protein ParG [Erwinia sp. ACCC 02193]|jgi:hypothetical protein|uniref:Plasmid partition protein ParG n=1 Tax=Erwinia aeris TaxID=3239803 RepID=A0ABV4EDM7_9GAMM